jgi:alpha-D-xyloside xylohydrolase
MGIAGIPWWTTDIGGFHGGRPENEDFRELLVRWFQWGAYCPVMRLHGDRQPGAKVYRRDGTEALFTGCDNEVWSYGETVYPILKKYLTVREGLRPYTRRLMREAHEEGKPVLRAMFYEFPKDNECGLLKDQYMYGDRYLVAPVMYTGMRERSVYLPKDAKWKNVETGEVFSGGQTVTAQAPLDVIPVFEKLDS